jgi:hypothetical protein
LTPVPPCVPDIPPSNDFAIGKVKRNKAKGTASIAVAVPGAGTLLLGGKKVVAVHRTAPGAATLRLPVAGKHTVRKRLNETGKAKVSLKITFTPTGGSAASKVKKALLKKRI